MRRLFKLLGLARKYGAARLDAACKTALDADMIDVYRLADARAPRHAPRAARRPGHPARPLPAAREPVRPPARIAASGPNEGDDP